MFFSHPHPALLGPLSIQCCNGTKASLMVFQALYEAIKPAQRDASSNFSTYLNSSPAWAWPGAWPRRRYTGRQKSHLLSVPPFLGRGERSRRPHSPRLDAGTPSLGISSFIYSLAGWFRPRAHPKPLHLCHTKWQACL